MSTTRPQHRPRRTEAVPAAAPAAPEAPTAPLPVRSFAELGVPATTIAALSAAGIAEPFPIQIATLPDTLAGRDVLGRGRTGSGKTLAFSIPLVARLTGGTRRPRQPRGLVLVPTRELANQVLAVVEPLARAARLTSAVVFGGVGQNPQVQALARGIDILIACPGRLEDLVGQRHCDLSAVEVTVLDEADHMADLGFLPGVKRLLDRTPRVGQRMLFSATLDNGVDVLVKRYLTDPVTHSVDPAVAPVATMTHHVFAVSAADKPAVIQELAAGQERSLLFMRTKHTAKRLAKQLTAAGIPAVELHGNLSQGARERNLAAFTEGSTRVLVATDIAARGIHVDDVALVVHVDPPSEHKAYLHRSGRTARAGAGGTVITLALPEQTQEVRTLARQAGIRPTTVSIRPGSPEITRLAGPPAPYVAPAPVVEERPGPRRSGGGSGGQRGDAARGPSSGGAKRTGAARGRSGGAGAPARTRAELAARAGQQPARGVTPAEAPAEATIDPAPVPTLRRRDDPRTPVVALFVVLGVASGSLAARIPAIQHHLRLSDGRLGVALLGTAAGTVVAGPLSGVALRTVPARRWIAVGLVPAVVFLPLTAVAGGPLALLAVLFCFGLGMGSVDVAVNTEAGRVELLLDRRVMSGFHASFSVGTLLGALVGAGAAAAGIGFGAEFLAVAGVVALAGAAAVTVLGVPAAPPAAPPVAGRARPSSVAATVAVLAVVCFACMLSEGAAEDWSALYLRTSLGASAPVASLAFGGFAAAMVVGRLVGDRLVERWNAVRVGRAAALVAAGGLAAGLASGRTVGGVAGFALLGLGLSVGVPLVVTAASAAAPTGSAVAVVTTFGYVGFLSGPPLIGALASVASLRAALGLVVGLCVVVAALAGRLRTDLGTPVGAG